MVYAALSRRERTKKENWAGKEKKIGDPKSKMQNINEAGEKAERTDNEEDRQERYKDQQKA